MWEKEPGLEVSESEAVLESLSAGETRILSFYIDPDMDQKSNLELELFAKTENPVSLEKAAEKQLTLQQGKASFTVKKTADCDNASPGETVTYQISIHNTGRHSAFRSYYRTFRAYRSNSYFSGTERYNPE